VLGQAAAADHRSVPEDVLADFADELTK